MHTVAATMAASQTLSLPHKPSLFHVKACCLPFLELVITDYNSSDYETPLYYWSSRSAVRNQGM